MPTTSTSQSIRRVLVVAPTPFFGDRGCHVRIYEEVRALQARGVDVLVVTYPTGRDVAGVRTQRSAAVPGLRARDLGPSYGRPFLDLLLLGTTLRAIRSFRPQIVHAHLHEGVVIGTVARALTGTPLVADLQGSLESELVDHRFIARGGLAARGANRLEHWLLHQPDAILTSNTAGVSGLLAHGATPNHLVSLPDGVDLQDFRPGEPDPALRAELGLCGKQVVVFLGVLTAYQGVDVLIDAIPAVVEAVPHAHFLIMGYPHDDHYRALVAARGLQASATLPGRIPYTDAVRWLSLGDVAVSPKESLTEANGKLLNYMACGLPVVATDTPVNRELLGDAGVYVPLSNPAMLAQRIVELLQAPERRAQIGSALRKRAEAHFAWPALCERLVDVYRHVLDHRPLAGPMP